MNFSSVQLHVIRGTYIHIFLILFIYFFNFIPYFFPLFLLYFILFYYFLFYNVEDAFPPYLEKAKNWKIISLACRGSVHSRATLTVTGSAGSRTSGGSPLRSVIGGKPAE
jgi:hypothetical protein